ncbi:MAG: N-acetyltransferase [Candidatus Nitronauta litoralis]|uniref:N-acetyltransferase n=1 Tax=Candidatus Nitronauta litoralis TaxID=2705533 RepID=A0A7T0BUR7_9BACT|nr:MAG: N-acetyltransferase [Candidatus Nitronauta litoralis]
MIRKATLPDIDAIHTLLVPRAQAGTVLPRSREDIESNLRDIFVFENEGRVLGTCSLVHMGEKLAEVRSLVVDSEFGRKGIGTALIQACIDDALELGYERIFALTYVVPVFANLGFHVANMSELPYKVWKDCQTCPKKNNCDETAVIRDLVTVKVEDLPEVLRDPDSDPAISIEDFS